jgi:hypothetical protein
MPEVEQRREQLPGAAADEGIDGRGKATQVADAPPLSPPEPSAGASPSYDDSPPAPEAPREPAPERDYAPPPRAEQAEADFARGASSDNWAPPERSFDERPPEPPPAPPAPSEPASSESVAVPANERQAG